MGTIRWKGTHAFREILFWITGTNSDADSSPSITAGAAAPSSAEIAGSLYLRTNGTLYKRQSDAWELVPDSTDTDKLSVGSIAVAEGVFTGQPSDADTLTIGADVYEWDSNAAATEGRIRVIIGGSAELSLDALIAAINTSGTENILASKSGTDTIIIQSADNNGGTATNTDPSIVLADSTANFTWRPGNVNLNTLSGSASAYKKSSRATLTATTALIGGASAIFFQFEFTPVDFLIQVRSSVGVLKQNVSDQFTISGNRIVWTSAGATHVANTDIVSILAWE